MTDAPGLSRQSLAGAARDCLEPLRAPVIASGRLSHRGDGYHDSEYFWYYLLGEGRGADDDLALADQVTPDHVEEYFATGAGPIGVAVASAGLGEPPLYTASADQAEDLARRGLTVTAVAPDVWRIAPR